VIAAIAALMLAADLEHTARRLVFDTGKSRAKGALPYWRLSSCNFLLLLSVDNISFFLLSTV